jgi:TonB-linked SusC/RagA family outer membrane protein
MKRQLFAVGIALCLSVPVAAVPAAHFDSPTHFDKFFQTAISGKVTDQDGLPLSGVTVTVKDTRITVATDASGSFSLQLPAGATTLVFSYVGYEEQEVTINGQSSIAVQLKPAAGTMQDVVVIGYGSQKKVNLTGAVSSVSGDLLTQRPAPNAATLLQGRLAGLQVTQPSAEPGRDNPTFLIRGRGSFGGSTVPLVLIDGVTGNFNNLSPDDIESVTILKDAASASIYGARAANGVVLVTTKKGKKGQTRVNYRVNIASHRPTALPDFVTNSAEYMEMYNKAAERSGVAFRYPQEDIDAYKNATDRNRYPNFDPVDYYFNPALVMNHNLSVSGGTEKSTYNLSLGYLDQEAMLPGYDFKRYNALLNYSNQLSKTVTVGTILNLTYKDRKEPPFTSENMALLVYASGPLYGPFLPDGSGRIVSRGYQNEGRNRNPEEAFAMGWQNFKEYNFNGQAYMDVKFLKNFVWSSKVAVNYTDEYYKMYQHPYEAYLLNEIDPATGYNRMSTFGPDIIGVTDQYAKTITPTIYSTVNYAQKFGDHDVKALVGYEQLYHSHQNLRGRRTSTVSPVLTDLRGYTSAGEALYFTHPRLPSLAGPSEWAMQSVFGRVNYNYKGKYFVEGNLRYDGTSKVSPDYRWGLFPSFSAGWLMSEENFMIEKMPWLSVFKLRASYGTLGNQDIGTYLYQDNLVISNVYYPFGNAALEQGAVVNAYRDQSLRWESTSILDFGVDLEILKGLFTVTFDWFSKTSFDILASQPVPASLGLSQPTLNIGKLRNKGIELDIRHNNRVGDVQYTVFGQVSTAKNKVLEISVPSFGSSIRQVGYPYDEHYLYIWDGIFQEEDIDDPKVPEHALNPNPRPGDLKMKDINGDGVVDAEDRVMVKGVYPDYIYSFGFNVEYKGFALSTFFQGVQGIKHRVNNWGVDPFMQGTPPTTKWRNAWTPENRSNTIPAIYVAGYQGVAAYGSSTYYLQDASYLRLKNIMLSYTLPQKVYRRIGANGLMVYISADNLITWTDYEGSDPERTSSTGNYVQYPQAIILNAGLNVRF